MNRSTKCVVPGSLVAVAGWVVVVAASVHADPPPPALSIEVVEAKIEEVEAATEIGAETRAKVVETYRKAASALQAAQSWQAAAARFAREREEAPAETRARKRELEQKANLPVVPGGNEAGPLAELEAVLFQEEANRAGHEAKLAELETQIADETERPAAIRRRLAEARQSLAETETEVEPAGSQSTVTRESEPRQWLRAAQREALLAEIRALDEELLSQPARFERLTAERDLQALELERSTSRLRDLEAMVIERRRIESERAEADAAAAIRDVEGMPPAVRALAEGNAELTREIAELTRNLEKASGMRERASAEQERVAEDFRAAKQKLEIAGLSQALGMVLQEQRRTLPTVAAVRRQIEARERQIADIALQQIRHREERRGLRSLSRFVDTALAPVDSHAAELVRDDIEQLARRRRELLDQALALDSTVLRALGELDFAQRALVDVVVEYDQYLAGRLLWIRTVPALTLADVGEIPGEIATVFAPARWQQVAEQLVTVALPSPTMLLAALVFALLLARRRSIRTALRATSANVGRPTSDDFYDTVQAIGWTLLQALPWPLLVGAVGWHLVTGDGAGDFTRAVGKALGWMARTLLLLELIRLVCVPGGLAHAHFGWSETALRGLRRALAKLMAGFLASGFLVAILVEFRQVPFAGGLGRLALLGMVGAIAVFAAEVLGPRRGALRAQIAAHAGALAERLVWLWPTLAIGTLLGIGGLVIAGYFYAAAALTTRLVRTFALGFGLVVLHELAVRWLTLTHRRLAYRAAVERREAARAARELGERAESSASDTPLADSDEPMDLAALSDDTQKLLNAGLWLTAVLGLWMVWWSVLPALGVLDEFTLWSKVESIGGVDTAVPITLGDLAMALLISFIAAVAVRRLPALLQFAVLERFSVSAGSQYAISALASYAAGAIGFLLATNAIGLDWSQVQWLVAALGVGIGFGLQEIVANFISGLIILFERPVRVGDVVTVGDTDGVVTRIRIRATTIRTWERKELLVPNKEFVTSRLLNWSLSDPVTRISVLVGIAYGSDVRKAMDTILEIAQAHPRVTDDPAPSVIFEAFGDNSLAMHLRCFVDSLDARLSTMSELHEEINRRFEEAGIVIAFPQRDLYLKSIAPIDVRLRDVAGEGS